MSDNGKVKIYKNPNRGRSITTTPYVPEYKQHNIEPLEYKPATIVIQQQPKTTASGPARVIQPYQIPGSALINELPNVGNNFEQTWGSVDGEIIDDMGIDLSQPLIDNNNFVSFVEEELLENKNVVENQEVVSDELSNIITQLIDDEYLLLVRGQAVMSGDSTTIKSEIYQLLVESDISIDDIMVIKKVKTTFGITLD